MDEYKLVGKIGSGTYGDVYKAYHKITKQIKAIKISSLDKGTEAEMEFLAKVKHPFIIRVDELIKEKSKANIVMELGT